MGLTAWTYELFQSWNILPKDDRVARPKTCEFCAKIASSARDETFVHADDALVVFEDWKPAAARHYLVCPREHITSANALSGAGRREGDDDGGDGDRARGGGGDAAMARRMLELGKEAIARDYADATTTPDTKFGFHLPPFNSVDHLHMHAFALPFYPPWKEHKYGGVLGSVAFAEATDVIERLEREEAEAAAAEAEAGRRSNL